MSFNVVIKDLDVRLYDHEKDYPIAQKWWLSHNAAYLEHEFLPKTGVVVLKNGRPIGMAWIYFSNSLIAQLSWVVTEPKLGPKTRLMTVTMLMDTCEKIAIDQGFKMIQMFSDHKGLTKIAEGAKYISIKPHDFLVKYVERST